MTDSAAMRTRIKRALTKQRTVHRLDQLWKQGATTEAVSKLDEPHKLELAAHYKECRRRIEEVMPPV